MSKIGFHHPRAMLPRSLRGEHEAETVGGGLPTPKTCPPHQMRTLIPNSSSARQSADSALASVAKVTSSLLPAAPESVASGHSCARCRFDDDCTDSQGWSFLPTSKGRIDYARGPNSIDHSSQTSCCMLRCASYLVCHANFELVRVTLVPQIFSVVVS